LGSIAVVFGSSPEAQTTSPRFDQVPSAPKRGHGSME
jgi:hypothetical protein